MYAASIWEIPRNRFSDVPARRARGRRALRLLLEGFRRCPAVACALAQIALGIGMVAAVSLAVLAAMLPVWALCLL